MKTRAGFISNSSSSSFVVKRMDPFETKQLLSKEEEILLTDYGFKPAEWAYASQIEAGLEPGETRLEKADILYYSVYCNQDEVVYFLVKNNIPFTAACHYGHENLFFARDAKEVLSIANRGLAFETYQGCSSLLEPDCQCVFREKVEDILKDGE